MDVGFDEFGHCCEELSHTDTVEVLVKSYPEKNMEALPMSEGNDGGEKSPDDKKIKVDLDLQGAFYDEEEGDDIQDSNPPTINGIDGRTLSIDEIEFEKYVRENFDQDAWLKKAKLIW